MYGWWFAWPLLLIVLLFLSLSWWPATYRWQRGPYSDEPWSYGGSGAAGARRLWPWRGRSASHRGKGPIGYRRSDSRIAEDVCDALLVNDDLDASDISVNVTDGIVALSGYTSSRSEKRLAEALADSVPGVRDVKNELQIGSPPRREAPTLEPRQQYPA